MIEVNPRSSRTIPFISKVTGVPMVRLAVKAMLGRTLKEEGYEGGLWKRQKLVAVKAPVFSMSKLTGVDTYLGPEMKSTGEVMGIDNEFTPAVAKALMAAGLAVKPGDSVLLSIADRDKAESVQMMRDLNAAGCTMYATEGTAAMIYRSRSAGDTHTEAAVRRTPQRGRRHRRRDRAGRGQHGYRRP